MSTENAGDLLKFMLPYPDKVKAAVLWLRIFVWDLYPETNKLIYDNYYTVAIGWSPTDKAGDVFCSIAVLKTMLTSALTGAPKFLTAKKWYWAMPAFTAILK